MSESDCFAPGPVSKQQQVLTGDTQSHGNSFGVVKCVLCVCVCKFKRMLSLQIGAPGMQSVTQVQAQKQIPGGRGDPARLFQNTTAAHIQSHTNQGIFITALSLSNA